MDAARWRGSWSIPAPIMISTAPTCRFTAPRGRRMPPGRSVAIAPPIRRRAPIRKNASPNGWRGESMVETRKRASRMVLKQTSLSDRFDDAPGRRRFWLARTGLWRSRRRRPIRIRGGRDMAIRKFDGEMRARIDRRGGMQGEAALVAHQGKAARQHAAIGQRRQQLAAVDDA